MKFKKGQISLELKIDKEIEHEFDSLPNQRCKGWTPETDEMIRRYWRKKDQMAFWQTFEKKFFKVGMRTICTRAKTLGI